MLHRIPDTAQMLAYVGSEEGHDAFLVAADGERVAVHGQILNFRSVHFGRRLCRQSLARTTDAFGW